MLETNKLKESVTIESEFNPIYLLAWKMILRASAQERMQMEISGTPARRKLKREVMAHVHDPITRQLMDETIERIADDYLQQAKGLEFKTIEPEEILSKEEADYIKLVHHST